mgnify:CR=1 FL=1
MSTKRICMWSGPRNVSTAFMYCFAQRSDTLVVDEPLYAHYLKETGVEHPGREEVLVSMESDGLKVIDQVILGKVAQPVLFIKNMGHHFINLPEDFLFKMQNMFLVRHPEEMLPSLVKKIPEPVLLDTAYELQYQIMQKLLAKGQRPIVVDSKYLLLNPEKTLHLLCEALQIPFDKNMLEWQAGARPEDGVWAKYWYSAVHSSTGFAPYEKKNEKLSDRLHALLEQCQYYYEKLSAYSINK